MSEEERGTSAAVEAKLVEVLDVVDTQLEEITKAIMDPDRYCVIPTLQIMRRYEKGEINAQDVRLHHEAVNFAFKKLGGEIGTFLGSKHVYVENINLRVERHNNFILRVCPWCQRKNVPASIIAPRNFTRSISDRLKKFVQNCTHNLPMDLRQRRVAQNLKDYYDHRNRTPFLTELFHEE